MKPYIDKILNLMLIDMKTSNNSQLNQNVIPYTASELMQWYTKVKEDTYEANADKLFKDIYKGKLIKIEGIVSEIASTFKDNKLEIMIEVENDKTVYITINKSDLYRFPKRKYVKFIAQVNTVYSIFLYGLLI